MLTKRKILVIIGIIVAILITFYTGVFGMTAVAWTSGAEPRSCDADTDICNQNRNFTSSL